MWTKTRLSVIEKLFCFYIQRNANFNSYQYLEYNNTALKLTGRRKTLFYRAIFFLNNDRKPLKIINQNVPLILNFCTFSGANSRMIIFLTSQWKIRFMLTKIYFSWSHYLVSSIKHAYALILQTEKICIIVCLWKINSKLFKNYCLGGKLPSYWVI